MSKRTEINVGEKTLTVPNLEIMLPFSSLVPSSILLVFSLRAY